MSSSSSDEEVDRNTDCCNSHVTCLFFFCSSFVGEGIEGADADRRRGLKGAAFDLIFKLLEARRTRVSAVMMAMKLSRGYCDLRKDYFITVVVNKNESCTD